MSNNKQYFGLGLDNPSADTSALRRKKSESISYRGWTIGYEFDDLIQLVLMSFVYMSVVYVSFSDPNQRKIWDRSNRIANVFNSRAFFNVGLLVLTVIGLLTLLLVFFRVSFLFY